MLNRRRLEQPLPGEVIKVVMLALRGRRGTWRNPLAPTSEDHILQPPSLDMTLPLGKSNIFRLLPVLLRSVEIQQCLSPFSTRTGTVRVDRCLC